ncbi:MAG: ABC transporter ATP-binding protein [Candidatus Contubernalis sp.]|nr:ABC transporter ATP-binding protein [Candidatus Contubernalis sp.]
MMETIISVQELTKVYGDKRVVDGVSFTVNKAEIFGLLGPNGAGKTTILECLEGLRIPESGSMSIMGVDPIREPGRLRSLIGVQLQSGGLPATIKVREAMQFFSAYHKVTPRMDLLERLNLAEKREAEYHTLSTGQQRRLALALAVAHEPPVLFLDEPTAGLDVASRTELHRLMIELKEAGTTIILSTHDMAEAEEMADRVAILLRGRIVTVGTPRELTATGSGFTKISVRTVNNSTKGVSLPSVVKQLTREDYNIFYTHEIGPSVTAIIACIEQNRDTLIDLRVERPTLEERFLELTKEGAVR